MKTQDLVALLASEAAPVDRRIMSKRFSQAMLLGALGALLLMMACFGLRPDLGRVASTFLFWFKLAFPLALAAASLWTCTRLSRPGVAIGWANLALAAPVAIVWITAIPLVLLTPASQRVALLLGHTWRVCPFAIALLSIPAFIMVFWAIKGLAPTRLRLAGAAGGLLAGAMATIVYCLHCPEMGVPFWAIWYLLGMLIPALAGALLGPRCLRW